VHALNQRLHNFSSVCSYSFKYGEETLVLADSGKIRIWQATALQSRFNYFSNLPHFKFELRARNSDGATNKNVP
jgi:hypothetical protein